MFYIALNLDWDVKMIKCYLYHIIDPDCENYTCESIMTTKPIPEELKKELSEIIVDKNKQRFAEIMNDLVTNYGLKLLPYTDLVITDRHKVSPHNGWGWYIREHISESLKQGFMNTFFFIYENPLPAKSKDRVD